MALQCVGLVKRNVICVAHFSVRLFCYRTFGALVHKCMLCVIGV